MANIVNDKDNFVIDQTIPSLELFAKKRKDLINHVAFDELYGHNGVIGSIRGLSSTMFTKFIDMAIEDARKDHEVSPFYSHEFRQPGDSNYGSYQYGFIVDSKGAQYAEGLPNQLDIRASVIEILDGFHGLQEYPLDQEHSETYTTLKLYTTLGLYPIIMAPPADASINESVEKFDAFEIGPHLHIGMIVDVYEDRNPADQISHLYAVILWDPLYTLQMPDYMYGHKSGTISMHNSILTPHCWRDMHYTFRGNFGIPVYEYVPDRSIIFHIQNSPMLRDLINIAVISGTIELDYTQFLIGKIAAVTDQLGVNNPVDDTSAIITGITDEPETDETEGEKVPVINAEDTDDYAERMKRLFRPPEHTAEDDMPFYGSITETLLKGNYPELG